MLDGERARTMNCEEPVSARLCDGLKTVVLMRDFRVLQRMSGLIKTLSILAFIFVASSGCTKTSFQNASVDNLISSLEKKSYLVKQFRADFVKVRSTPIFKRDVSVKGRLVFQRPNRFLLTISGDANVEILSDGENVTLVHDKKDRESFRLKGERDIARFADPLMMVIQSIGDGGMRRFSLSRTISDNGSVVLDALPNGQVSFERIEKAVISISDFGEIERISVLFKDGNRDETLFRSWALLSQDDPAVLELNNRLEGLSHASRFTHIAPRNYGERKAEKQIVGQPLISLLWSMPEHSGF